jgi:DNA-binding transcriptional LysR family regulator
MIDRLALMRTLIAVERTKNFSGAARSLGISASLASRHLTHLEREVGVELVLRSGRGVTLTDAGSQYAAFASRILGEIDRQDAMLAHLRDELEGPLNIISPKWLGSLELGDAVAEFAKEHPSIHVRFDAGAPSDQTYQFIDSGFDVSFHTHDLRDSSLKVKKLAALKFVVCAAPSYLERVAPPATPRDLSSHRCLVHSNDSVWTFQRGTRLEHIKIATPNFTSNTYLTLHKAALHGAGVALLPWRPVHTDVFAGRLRVVLSDHPVPERPLFAVYPPGRQPVRRVRAFLDGMQAWFRDHPIPDPPAHAT